MNENMTELVLVTLWDGVEEGKSPNFDWICAQREPISQWTF